MADQAMASNLDASIERSGVCVYMYVCSLLSNNCKCVIIMFNVEWVIYIAENNFYQFITC